LSSTTFVNHHQLFYTQLEVFHQVIILDFVVSGFWTTNLALVQKKTEDFFKLLRHSVVFRVGQTLDCLPSINSRFALTFLMMPSGVDYI
jgi:hypothetical protein